MTPQSLRRRLSPIGSSFAAAICCAAALLPAAAQAGLGAAYSSIAADQAQMHASVKVTERAGYEVHELALPTGTTVREYVTGAGIVFAVAWNGPSMPNLRQMLGPYYADFKAAAQATPGSRNHLNLSRSDLKIQAGGHMRAFFGRAVLVGSVPTGVSSDELQ